MSDDNGYQDARNRTMAAQMLALRLAWLAFVSELARSLGVVRMVDWLSDRLPKVKP
jgi:hypothetical protein